MIAFLLLLDLMTGNLFLLFILAVVLTNEQIVNDISACVTPCHADEFAFCVSCHFDSLSSKFTVCVKTCAMFDLHFANPRASLYSCNREFRNSYPVDVSVQFNNLSEPLLVIVNSDGVPSPRGFPKT